MSQVPVIVGLVLLLLFLGLKVCCNQEIILETIRVEQKIILEDKKHDNVVYH